MGLLTEALALLSMSKLAKEAWLLRERWPTKMEPEMAIQLQISVCEFGELEEWGYRSGGQILGSLSQRWGYSSRAHWWSDCIPNGKQLSENFEPSPMLFIGKVKASFLSPFSHRVRPTWDAVEQHLSKTECFLYITNMPEEPVSENRESSRARDSTLNSCTHTE